MNKKRYYIKKYKGLDQNEVDYIDSRAVIDRLWDKTICRCYFKSDALKIKKALNAMDVEVEKEPLVPISKKEKPIGYCYYGVETARSCTPTRAEDDCSFHKKCGKWKK